MERGVCGFAVAGFPFPMTMMMVMPSLRAREHRREMTILLSCSLGHDLVKREREGTIMNSSSNAMLLDSMYLGEEDSKETQSRAECSNLYRERERNQ